MKTLYVLTGLLSVIWYGCSDSNPVSTTPENPSSLSSSSINVSSSSVVVSSSSVDNSSSSVVDPVSSSSSIQASETLTLWLADDGTQVSTGGYWYGYDDKNDGGTSTWACNGTVGAEGDDFGFCLREADGAVEVDYTVSADIPNGTNPNYGFSGIGFNLGEDVGGVKTPVDISAYTGIKIDYESDQKINMQIVYDEKIVEYDVHKVILTKGQNSSTFTFDQFKQEGWGPKGNLMENLDKITEIKFQAHSVNFEGQGKLIITNVELF